MPKTPSDSSNAETKNAAQANPAGTEIQLINFNLSAGGKSLLKDAAAIFPAGKLSLVLGCSGVGKSLLMRILAGLIDEQHAAIRYDGTIQFTRDGKTDSNRDHHNEPVAVVFQSFALFDELSPAENIQIAIDHSSQSSGNSRQNAGELLNSLGVPGDRPTSVLSGGQQQRLAIARAVGMNTDVVLYDEPTSGLDTNTAAAVAELIRDTQTQFQRTSIIVTHDYAALQGIADRVVLLNHHNQTLEEVAPEDWPRLSELLGQPPQVDGLTAAACPSSEK